MTVVESPGSQVALLEPSAKGASPVHDDIGKPRDRSPAMIAHIRIKNRRKRYLDLHPDYFSSSLELADPLAYDRLIRRFQSTTEREEEGRQKGYSGVLEADLWRSEAKIEALSNPSTRALMTYRRGQDGEILAEEKDEVPTDKEDGLRRWRKEMELRFVRGDDVDFDYGKVDGSEEYDDREIEEREEEQKWFEEEEPRWMTGSQDKITTETSIEGQTGVQDF